MMNNPIVVARLSEMDYQTSIISFEDVFKYSFEILNTEQILTGVALGYISSYTVRCHNCGYETDDRRYGYNATYIEDEDVRIPELREPIFLDIDLDFFRSSAEMGE